MKPRTILFTFLLIHVFTLGFMLIVPSGNITIFGNELEFITLEQALFPEEIEYADITDIQALDTATVPLDTVITDENGKKDTLRADPDVLLEVKHHIQFPEGKEKLFYGAYERFEEAKGKDLVRVLHFGDSQIEGDRITGFLRQKFQERWGGCGVGMVPIMEVTPSRVNVKREASLNWQAHRIFGKLDPVVPHRKYGVLGDLYRFTAFPDTGMAADTMPLRNFRTAWVSLETSKNAFPAARDFETFKMLYGEVSDSVHWTLWINEEASDSGWLPITDAVKLKTWDIPTDVDPQQVKLELRARTGPEVYSLMLDCHTGVVVDNIALRGSSGIEFTKMDKEHFGDQLDLLNVGMVIMQFGINVVPNEDVENYDWYEEMYYRQIKRLQNLSGAPVLVISLSDMSKKEGENIVSYENVELIRDAQKRAAFRAGAGFWDLYEAMGGKNSMPSWVYAEPPLAATDFTHFNHRGARIVAKMIYSAIIENYEEYREYADK